MSECTHDCSSCGANCPSRDQQQSLLEYRCPCIPFSCSQSRLALLRKPTRNADCQRKIIGNVTIQIHADIVTIVGSIFNNTLLVIGSY